MDPVLEQIIANIHPSDIKKTGMCYQKLSELPIKQDGKDELPVYVRRCNRIC